MRSLILTAVLVLLWLVGCKPRTPVVSIEVAGRQPAAAPAKSQPPRQKSTPITWDALILPHDDRFEPGDLPLLAEKLKDQRVTITGVMHGGLPTVKGNSQFVIMRNRSGKFGPGHPIDELMTVTLTPDRTVTYCDDDIQVDGIFRIEPVIGEDRYVWCVYHLDDARVSQSGTIIDEPAAKSKPPER